MSFPSRASSDAAPLLEEFSIQEEYDVQISEKLKNHKSLWFRFQSNSRKILIVLRPSFLLQNSSFNQQPHHTAWLDGCRGVASFLVYIYHWQHMFHQGFNYGYASNDGDNDHWLIQLPIVRLLVNGQVQVATFYVLSGISLSLRPLRLARSHDWNTLLHLWTIPVEFINSILLFVALVGLSQLRSRVRMSLTMMLWAYCMSWSVVESQTALCKRLLNATHMIHN